MNLLWAIKLKMNSTYCFCKRRAWDKDFVLYFKQAGPLRVTDTRTFHTRELTLDDVIAKDWH
jgi:hypothetical protein